MPPLGHRHPPASNIPETPRLSANSASPRFQNSWRTWRLGGSIFPFPGSHLPLPLLLHCHALREGPRLVDRAPPQARHVVGEHLIRFAVILMRFAKQPPRERFHPNLMNWSPRTMMAARRKKRMAVANLTVAVCLSWNLTRVALVMPPKARMKMMTRGAMKARL